MIEKIKVYLPVAVALCCVIYLGISEAEAAGGYLEGYEEADPRPTSVSWWWRSGFGFCCGLFFYVNPPSMSPRLPPGSGYGRLPNVSPTTCLDSWSRKLMLAIAVEHLNIEVEVHCLLLGTNISVSFPSREAVLSVNVRKYKT